MSKYTTQVRWIVEYYTPDFEGTINDRIVAALPHIFNFNFPIYQESYRTILETKIIKHYYMKEIGLETVQLWKLFLEERLNYIMPYYNKLYKALDEEIRWNIDYDIWEDFTGNQTDVNQVNSDVTGTHTQKTTDNLEGSGSTDSTGKVTQEGTSNTDTSGNTQNTTTASDKVSTINSNFPQASYQDNVDYASDSTVTDSNAQGTNNTTTSGTSDTTTNSTTNSTNNSTMLSTSNRTIDVSGNDSSNTKTNATNERGNKHMMHRAGINGARSYSQLFQEYLNTLMDVDQQIIQNLHDLFMEVY